MPRVHFANTAPMVLKESNIGDMHTPTEGMLQLEQKEFVIFNHKNAEATVHFKCIAQKPVTYKIQTTSPEKFRVRPRCGIISPNEKAEISIWLKSEYKLSDDCRDKFLVMAMVVPGSNAGADVADLWRNKCTGGPEVEQHRLVCRFEDSPNKCVGKELSTATKDYAKGEKGDNKAARLHTFILYFLVFMVMLLSAAVGFLYFDKYYPAGSCGKQSGAFCPARRK